jgi:hypothetical protein
MCQLAPLAFILIDISLARLGIYFYHLYLLLDTCVVIELASLAS